MRLMQTLKRILQPTPKPVATATTDDMIKADIDRKHRELQRRLDAQIDVITRHEPKDTAK